MNIKTEFHNPVVGLKDQRPKRKSRSPVNELQVTDKLITRNAAITISQDGEKFTGVLVWYDLHSLAIDDRDSTLVFLKRNIDFWSYDTEIV